MATVMTSAITTVYYITVFSVSSANIPYVLNVLHICPVDQWKGPHMCKTADGGEEKELRLHIAKNRIVKTIVVVLGGGG